MTDETITPAPPDTGIEAERVKYAEVWQMRGYRNACHGLDLWRHRRDIFPPNPVSVLDIGAGTGRLFGHLRDNGIHAEGIDLVDGLDPEIRERHGKHFHQMPVQSMARWEAWFDLGICADVMEHLPEADVDIALQAIDAVTDTTVFLIANHESSYGGHDLHLTRQPPEWWAGRLNAIFMNVERLPYIRRKRDADDVFLFRCS